MVLWVATVPVSACSDVTTNGHAGAGAGSIAPNDKCVGVEPPAAAYDAEPGPKLPNVGGAGGQSADGGGGAATSGAGGIASVGAGGSTAAATGSGGAGSGQGGSANTGLRPTQVGSERPVYQLTDFQPLSCGVGATYGLDVFQETVTVAVLLAAW